MRRIIFWVVAFLRQHTQTVVDWFRRMRDVFVSKVKQHWHNRRQILADIDEGFSGGIIAILSFPALFFKTLWNGKRRILIGILLYAVVIGPIYGATALLSQDSCFRDTKEITGNPGMLWVAATFTPHEANFAEPVLAEYILVMDADGVVHTDELVVEEPDFTPYEIIGEPMIEREVICGELIIKWSVKIECLGSFKDPTACLPSANPGGLSFEGTRVHYVYDRIKRSAGKIESIEEKKTSIIIQWPRLQVRSFMTVQDVPMTPAFDPGPYHEPEAPGIKTPFGTFSYETAGMTIIFIAAAGLTVGLLFVWRRYIWVQSEDDADSEWLSELRNRIEHAAMVYREPPGTNHYSAMHAMAKALRNSPVEELRGLSSDFEALAHPKYGGESVADVQTLLTELRALLPKPDDEKGEQ